MTSNFLHIIVEQSRTKPRFAPLALVLLMAFSLHAPVNAQQAESFVNVDSVTVGDRFKLTVMVGHDGTRNALFPHQLLPDSLQALHAPFTLGDFEIIEILQLGGRPYSNGGRIDSVVYEATTFALDSARVAGIPVGLSTERDTVMVMSAELIVPIQSLVPEDATEIMDIAPLAEFPRSIWPWIIGVLAFIAVILGLWWWRKSKEEDGIEADGPIRETPPYDEAVSRLTQLEAFDLNDPLVIKPFYVELTDILRTYVGKRTHTPALESTTRELLERLKHSSTGEMVPGEVLTHIDQVLSHADLVKFADLKPILEQTRAMVLETRGAIDQTETVYREREIQRKAAERARLEAEQYAPKERLVEEDMPQ